MKPFELNLKSALQSQIDYLIKNTLWQCTEAELQFLVCYIGSFPTS